MLVGLHREAFSLVIKYSAIWHYVQYYVYVYISSWRHIFSFFFPLVLQRLSKCVFKYVQMRSFSILAVSLLPISLGLLSLPGFPWIHGLGMCSFQGRIDTGRKNWWGKIIVFLNTDLSKGLLKWNWLCEEKFKTRKGIVASLTGQGSCPHFGHLYQLVPIWGPDLLSAGLWNFQFLF